MKKIFILTLFIIISNTSNANDSYLDEFNEWLSKNKAMLGELKIKNPIAYTTFMEDFQVHKTNLQTKGVI